MAETRNPEQPEKKGLLSTLFGLAFKLFAILLVSLFFSVVFEYIGLTFFWSDEGWKHTQAMFNTELHWLSENFRQSLIIQAPVQTVTWILEWVYQWVFVETGFIDFTQQARINSRGEGTLAMASATYLGVENYVLATVYVILTFIVRLTVLILSVPLFVLAILTGATDGLMRRDLRRFGAGRESSFIYHRAKRLIVPLLIAPWVIYLSIPVTANPIFVLIPCAIALGLAVMITTATFKKYL